MPAWQNSMHSRNLGGAQTPLVRNQPTFPTSRGSHFRLPALNLPLGGVLPPNIPSHSQKVVLAYTRVESAQGRPAVQQLTDVEVRKFYAAYRALEKRAHKLGRTASNYHEAAIWRDLLIAALATFLLVLWIA